MKKMYNKIVEQIEHLSVGTQVVIIGISIGVLVVALTNPLTKNAYNEGYKAGRDATVLDMRTNAINAGVAEYVITNKLTGESTFQWFTNSSSKYLFPKK